ncbi:MAG: MACPF domain-containing protein [Candidatus Bathyarchaeota archaeon]|uniref:MAC/perforin domain-containing protein n=2 Tax=Candidatus Bathycorpusculum sp. TaxID=2994959 RepID=UPI002827CFA7|nr:MACPF domain-containing protein [Candidatus Termiticorpusculum sp.]MCL2291763.1 MACPF domain-containing protein [Candidatus Termiticorpusculum sp.]
MSKSTNNIKLIKGKALTIPTGSSKSQAIGRGYNVITSQYIVPWEIKCDNPIIDTTKLDSLIKKTDASGGTEDFIEGSSATEFVKNLNVKLGASVNLGLFSAEAKIGFDFASKSTEKMVFVQCRTTLYSRREYFEGDTYKQYLTAQFKADLNSSMLPQDLFTKYGTHLIKQIYFGGRLCFNYLYTMSSNENSTKITTDIKASYLGCTGSSSTSTSETWKETVSKCEISTLHVGGGDYDMSNLDQFKKNYATWKASVTNNPMPCDIVNIGNLVPIWTFCTNATRAKTIEDKYVTMLNEEGKGLIPKTNSIIECCFVTSTKSEGGQVAKRKCPSGYDLVDIDLNAGAGGNYIYLCYKKATTGTPITDMFIDYYSNAQTACTKTMTHNGTCANYTMLPIDLNAGAGGKFIYLWITKDQKKLPIKEINAFMDSKESTALTAATTNNWNVVQWFNSSGGADLNKGAGGKFIYISVKR